MGCSLVPLQVMEFYCESCETAMCLDCTEGEHREHVTVPLRDVLEQHKAALKNQLDAIHNRYMSYILNSQMLYTVHHFINKNYIIIIILLY